MSDFEKAKIEASTPRYVDEKFALNQCEYWADWDSLDEDDKNDTIDGYLQLYSAGFKQGAEWAKKYLTGDSSDALPEQATALRAIEKETNE